MYWDNGKENGNDYSGFRVRGSHPHIGLSWSTGRGWLKIRKYLGVY